MKNDVTLLQEAYSTIYENTAMDAHYKKITKANEPIENASKYLGNYEYIGTCVSTVDDSCIWDATEMAQLIENSKPFDIEGIYPFLSDELKQKVKNNPSEIESGINDSIIWVYDTLEDIHYFYKRIYRFH